MRKLFLFVSFFLCIVPLWSQSDWSKFGTAQQQWYKANAVAVTAGTDTVYLAKTDSLKRSTDGGNTWNTLAIASPLAVACNPRNPKTVIVGVAGKLYRSTDGGTTFTEVLSVSNNPSYITFSKADTHYVYAGFLTLASATSLYRSTNGGASWTDVSAFGDVSGGYFTDVRQVAVVETDANYVYVVGEYGVVGANAARKQGIFYSVNATASTPVWENGDISSSLWGVGAYDSSGLIHVYIGYKHATVILKHHQGAALSSGSWNSITITNVDTIYNIQTSHDSVYLATNDGMYAKTGHTWNSGFSKVSSGIAPASLQTITIGAGNSAKMYAAGYGAVSKSTNFGLSWATVTPGFNLVAVSSVQPFSGTMGYTSRVLPAIGFVSGSTITNKSLDYGGVAQLFVGEHIDLHPNQSYWFATGAVGGKATAFRSSDNGTTWSRVISSTTTSTSLHGTTADPYANLRVYAYGDGSSTTGNYYTSDDAGGSFTLKKVDAGTNKIYSFAIDPTNPGLYSKRVHVGLQSTGSTNGGVFKTEDITAATPTWVLWTPPLGAARRTIFAVTLNPNYPSTVYAGGNPKTGSDIYTMWISTNSGSSWDTIGARTDTVKRILIDPRWRSDATSSAVFVLSRATGGTDKIYRSSNRGDTWTDVTGSLPTPIYDLRSDPGDTSVIYVATASGVYVVDRLSPSLNTPANLDSVVFQCPYPQLSWSSVGGATSYRIQISSNASFTSIVKDTITAATQYSQYSATYGQFYYWRVDAITSFGESPWSAAYSYYTEYNVADPPGAPTLNLPANGATNVALNAFFSWTNASGVPVVSDTLIIANNSSFTSIFRKVAAGTSYRVSQPLLSSYTTYYWKVQSVGYCGSSTSTVRSFTTGNEAEASKILLPGLSSNLPERTQLYQNYPNPFNPVTNIRYALREDGHVVLRIYSILGKQIAELFNGYRNAGYYEEEFDAGTIAGGLPSGVYFYSLQAGKTTEIKKMLIMK